MEAAILFYAGWLGHYVGDGSQPLHVTVQYNGWTGPNPNGYTTEHTIHSQFETAYVDAVVSEGEVQALMTPAHPIGDEWDDYLAYLRHTSTLIEKVYQLDKLHGFDGTGTPEAKQFTEERLAAGASMLRDLYVAAWVKSADPVPDWHDHAEAAPSTSPSTTSATTPATTPDDGDVRRIGPGVKPPILKYAPDPKFSDEARRLGIQGVCVVGLVVTAQGEPKDVHIVRSLGHGLDEQSIAIVRRYRFAPAMYKGQPVAVEINIEVNYRDYR